MDIDDLSEWLLRCLVAVGFFMAAVVVIMLLLAAVNEVVFQIRRRRQRQRRGTTTPVPPSSSVVEELLLQSIPDVPYQKLPPGGGDSDNDSHSDSDRDRESCVICVTPYNAGEACSVLPACKHLFHKACVATWLRVRCTCPLCRAAVALPLPHPPPQGSLNAAENMV